MACLLMIRFETLQLSCDDNDAAVTLDFKKGALTHGTHGIVELTRATCSSNGCSCSVFLKRSNQHGGIVHIGFYISPSVTR